MAFDESTIWEDVELAESFLVCCMYEEAVSKSSSVLRCVSDPTFSGGVEESQLHVIKEAAGMVLIQSLKELRRSQDIVAELMQLFGEITAIPVEVILPGACIQISEAPAGVQRFLEEFLSKWKCVDENHYVIAMEHTSPADAKNPHVTLPLDKYMEVVEVYAVVLLGKVLNNVDVAVSWVETAEVPEAKRQDLLRKLHSLYSQKSPSMLQASQPQKTEQESHLSSRNGLPSLDGSSIDSKEADVCQQSILNLSSKVDTCFWLFRSVTLRFGKVRVVITTGQFLLTCLICIAVYFIKRKRQTLLRTVTKQVASARKALIDLWQLAFSYQVNPLAAVQPLPAATRVTE